MSSIVHVAIHRSQFPEAVRRDLLESLRTRRLNHKFLYDSIKQTQKWLALHQAYSPSRTHAECAAVYERSFQAIAARISVPRVHLVGVGCGGGQKDARLLKLLRNCGKQVSYTPLDVSAAMVLVARQAVMGIVGEKDCFPLVCDLASAEDLPEALEERWVPGAARLLTFFGMMPNFEPQMILPRIAALLRAHEFLLLSANLAPGAEYAAGVKKILPLYDNALTREWLMGFLLDLGVEQKDGKLRFVIERVEAGKMPLIRIAAYYDFTAPRQIVVDEETFEFLAGDAMRLFFSFRHTPKLVSELVAQQGLRVVEQWVAPSEDEGAFLISRG